MSHLYSFSFEPNPNWTREYPGQEEIQDYLIGVAHKYELYRHIRFNSSVESTTWDDGNLKWKTTVRQLSGKTADGSEPHTYTMTSDFFVAATGQLSDPKPPSLPGLDTFEGKTMHSSRWDWNYNIQGKKVGIIGTGATAAQIIPEIAPQCSSLTVFQRSPAWVVPRHDHEISALRRAIYRYVPPLRQNYRASLMDEREGKFEATFYPRSKKQEFVKELSKGHMLRQLPGEGNAELREKVTPDYPFSCKRIIVSDDFYPTLLRSNTTLETTSISHVTPRGIQMTDGTHHDLDLLILATGFNSTKFLSNINITGTDNQSLNEAWSRDGASAYLGITVPTLPNFGILYGPNTNLAYNSLILQIEAQSLYLTRLITPILAAKRKHQTLTLEPRADVTKQYKDWLQSKLRGSTFADQRCSSWFKDEKGRIVNNWAGSAVEYQKRVCWIDWRDFVVGGTGKGLVEGMGVERWNRRKEEGAWSVVQIMILAVGFVMVCLFSLWSWL